MERIVTGVLGGVGRIVNVVAKELIKGGMVIYVVTLEVCEVTSVVVGNMFEEAEAELEGREPHYKEVPKEDEEDLKEVEKVVEEGAIEILEVLIV